jgi:hypothetical protein
MEKNPEEIPDRIAAENERKPPPLPGFVVDRRGVYFGDSFQEAPSLSWFDPLVVLALTAFLDYLIYQGMGGLSFTVAFVSIPLVWLLVTPAHRPWRLLGGLYALHVLLAMRYAWQMEGYGVGIGFFIFVALSIVAMSGCASMPVLAHSSLPTLAFGCARFLNHFRVLERFYKGKAKPTLDGNFVKVVLVPVLVAALFALIFYFSNPILYDFMQNFLDTFSDHLWRLLSDFFPDPPRIFFWMVCLLLLLGLHRPHIVNNSALEAWFMKTSVATSYQPLAYRIALNTLLACNVVFLAYNVLDAWYLVVRREIPSHLNHSQYAHQGAIGLTIALVLSTLVLGYFFRDTPESDSRTKRLRLWACVWIAQNFLLGFWVLLRLQMYIGYNGLTHMRIVGLFGTALVVVGFALVAFKVVRDKSLPWLIHKEIVAFILGLVLLALTPTDALTWSYNTPRIFAMSTPRPAVQMTIQPISPGGLIFLVPLLEHPDEVIARGAAGLLKQWSLEQENDGKRKEQRWTQFQPSAPGVVTYALSSSEKPDEVIARRATAPLEQWSLKQENDGKRKEQRWTQYQHSAAVCLRLIEEHRARIQALLGDTDASQAIEALRQHSSRWI